MLWHGTVPDPTVQAVQGDNITKSDLTKFLVNLNFVKVRSKCLFLLKETLSSCRKAGAGPEMFAAHSLHCSCKLITACEYSTVYLHGYCLQMHAPMTMDALF